MQRKVVIGVPSLSPGNPVGIDALGMAGALLARGVDVRIASNEAVGDLPSNHIALDDVNAFLDDPKHVFICCFSGAWDAAEALLKTLECCRIVRYDSVTDTTQSVEANVEPGRDEHSANLRVHDIIARLVPLADEVWGTSAYGVDEFIAAGFPAQRTAVFAPFHGAGELLRATTDARWAEQLGDGHRNILAVGASATTESMLTLVRAISLLRGRKRDVRLVLASREPARSPKDDDALRKLIDTLQLDDHVVLADGLSTAELATAYRHASVFVSASEREGFGAAMVEAMAMNVPVVALDRGGVRQTLGDAGVLVQEGSPDALAQALAHVLTGDQERGNKVVAGRARYRLAYAPESVENRFVDVISPLLPAARQRARAIHQFHSGTAPGDAVTNGMFLTQRLLREMGFESEIFAEHVDRALTTAIRDFKTAELGPDDVLLLHHSMGHDQDGWVSKLSCRVILVYHNITPETFFPPESPFRHYSVKGRKQLIDFKPVFASAAADSELNAAELRELGYQDVEVLPLLIDTADIAARAWDDALVQREAPMFTVLFVGRVAPNKRQQDLLLVADQLRTLLRRPFQFVFVGGYDEADPFYHSVQVDIERLKLGDIVRFAGKVPEAELYAWYRAADVFLCMSDHEGFGVPLIEAMTFDLPVIAYNSSNVGATLGGAGLLINDKHPRAVASLIRLLASDKALRRTVIEGQRVRVQRFAHASLQAQLATFLVRQGVEIPAPPRPSQPAAAPGNKSALHYQVEGPFETSYSLALVNREIAFALEQASKGKTGLFATEGPGDYLPDPSAVEKTGTTALWKRGAKRSGADVVIRDLYPPRVADMDGLINLLYFAWEESGLNPEWVNSFNVNLDGMPVLSKFVQKVLLDNGVSLPSVAAGCGVDHIDRVERLPYAGTIGEGYRFLHVSSCFPRKGADVLVEAFAEAFPNDPGVTLVIKTFPNPHNTVAADIARVTRKYPDGPRFVLIEKDLPPGQIVDLYQRCDAYVAPSRGEGFGLPMAEAMWFGKPVITTAYGGHVDFCTDETAWLVDYIFATADTHMGLFDSVWAEPDVQSLSRQLKAVRHASRETLQPRLSAARALMEKDFTWARCAERTRGLEREIRAIQPLASRKLKVAWVSSWNTKCGIATYTDFLTRHLDPADFELHYFASKSNETIVPDTKHVTRCWTDRHGPAKPLLDAIDAYKPDTIVVQHNFGFHSMATLAETIRLARRRGIPIVITFHSTKDIVTQMETISLSEILDELKLADRLLVHGVDDLNRLRAWGLVDNAAIIPHGVLVRRSASIADARLPFDLPLDAKVISTYGFFLPHKGLEEMVEAFALILKQHPNAYLLMVNALYPVPVSTETANLCRARIQALGIEHRVRMVTDFLPDQESLAYLDASDLVVFPYQHTAESSSAAARYGMASNRPVACSPLTIFDDLNGTNHRLSGVNPEQIAASVSRLLGDETLLASKSDSQQLWLRAKSWAQVSRRLSGMLTGLVQAGRRQG